MVRKFTDVFLDSDKINIGLYKNHLQVLQQTQLTETLNERPDADCTKEFQKVNRGPTLVWLHMGLLIGPNIAY